MPRMCAAWCYKPPMKLVIFDCDGTLVDSQNAILASMEQAFAFLGLSAPTRGEMLGVVGLSLPQAFAALVPDADEAARAAWVDRYRSQYRHTAATPMSEQAPLYPGIAEAIATLGGRDDILLGIATGKSRRGVARVLEREGWHGRFITIQTADDHPSKPHPSMILQAMVEAGVEPEATVMIGDTTFDIEMALAARVGAIGVGWGYHAAERLTLAGAHTLAATCASLIETIDARLAAQAVCLAGREKHSA